MLASNRGRATCEVPATWAHAQLISPTAARHYSASNRTANPRESAILGCKTAAPGGGRSEIHLATHAAIESIPRLLGEESVLCSVWGDQPGRWGWIPDLKNGALRKRVAVRELGFRSSKFGSGFQFEPPPFPFRHVASLMQGLNLTYKTLGESRNEAAIDVLVAVALSSGNATTRHNAVSAMLQRTEKALPRTPPRSHWDRLDEQDIALLRERPRFMERAVRKTIKNRGPRQRSAIAAAKALGLTTAIDELVLLAESSSCRTTRQAAVDAIFEIVIPLGRLARADRDRSTIRRSRPGPLG